MKRAALPARIGGSPPRRSSHPSRNLRPDEAPKALDTIIRDAESAAAYDRQAEATHWHGPEIVFGLTFEFTRPGQTLLDLGIGSGLSSICFHKAGLHIHGLDGSRLVLKVCEAKGFAEELREHDLRDLPLPYAPASADVVVSVAVLHSFPVLDALFLDVARILKDGGIFAFTLENRCFDQPERYSVDRGFPSSSPRADEAVLLFRHRPEDIAGWLFKAGFTMLKIQEFRAYCHPTEGTPVFFRAYVVRKTGDPLHSGKQTDGNSPPTSPRRFSRATPPKTNPGPKGNNSLIVTPSFPFVMNELGFNRFHPVRRGESQTIFPYFGSDRRRFRSAGGQINSSGG